MASYVDLEGIWRFDQKQVLDDKLASKMSTASSDGMPVLHGTWTPLRHFFIKTERDGGYLLIFDENGCFCAFTVQDGTDENAPTWVSDPARINFSATPPAQGQVDSQSAGEQSSTPTIYLPFFPSLFLDAYSDESGCPYNMNIGDLYINSASGDQAAVLAVSIPQQTITYHPDNKTFYWSSDAHQPGLLFNKVTPAEPAPTGSPHFGIPFTAQQSQYAQVDFPFYGFDPRSMAINSAGGQFDTPGTPVQSGEYPSNPGQVLRYPLLFQFPASNTTNYQQYPDLAGAPNLPLGRSGMEIGTKVAGEHSVTLETVADRVSSYSSTIGFSAGAEKMLTVGVKSTFSSKVEAQQQNESRYTVARTAKLSWADIIDAPSAKLKEEFVAWIQDRTQTYLSGKDPDWPSFVDHFGTHYMHAMTRGWLEYSETRFSLQAETNANTTSSGLAVDASATLKGAKVKASAEVTSEWSSKLGMTFSSQDVQAFQMGTDAEPLAIFFDLRPITELLNPLFFQYNPADDWGQLAPWIWSKVRASLDCYLCELGLGQPLDASLLEDYTPHLVKVTIPKFWVTQEIVQGSPTLADWMAVTGTVKITDLDGDPSVPQDSTNPPDQQYALSHTDFQSQVVVSGNGTALSETQFCCTLALRKNAKAHLKLEFNLVLEAQRPPDMGLDMSEAFSGTQVIECEMTDKIVPQDYQLAMVESIEGADRDRGISYALHAQVQWEDLGWPPAPPDGAPPSQS